jgi:hypothetical protein
MQTDEEVEELIDEKEIRWSKIMYDYAEIIFVSQEK